HPTTRGGRRRGGAGRGLPIPRMDSSVVCCTSERRPRGGAASPRAAYILARRRREISDTGCELSAPRCEIAHGRVHRTAAEAKDAVKIAVQLGPAAGTPGDVAYRWDPDTEILSAQLSSGSPSEGMSGSVGLEGSDGSWLILDVSSGRISGVEIAVWPDVRKLPALSPPPNIEDARVVIPSRRSQPNIASMETTTLMIAE